MENNNGVQAPPKPQQICLIEQVASAVDKEQNMIILRLKSGALDMPFAFPAGLIPDLMRVLGASLLQLSQRIEVPQLQIVKPN
jgi:hypothetical protein